MSDYREIERMIYSCPNVDVNNLELYPYVSSIDFEMMEQSLRDDESIGHVYAFVRTITAIKPFVDVYIWDTTTYPQGYKRFVITEGKCLPEALEVYLFDYLKTEKYCAEKNNMRRLCEDVKNVFPQWHFRTYSVHAFYLAVHHMYFTSFRSGPREILYKADLSYLALELERIEGVNIVGTTPTSIIGHGFPLRLLRIIDDHYLLVGVFDDDEQMDYLRRVYCEYSGYIGQKIPTIAQWEYLDYLYRNGGVVGGHRFMRSLYNRLSEGDDDSVYEYERFLELRDEYPAFRNLKLPKAEDIADAVERLETYRDCVENDIYINEKIDEIRKSSSLEFSGNHYSIIMPRTARDFLYESIKQRNCVVDYMTRHIDGASVILFLRRNEAINIPYVTVEVEDGIIEQAKARFNSEIPEEAEAFLKEYAIKKGLIY